MHFHRCGRSLVGGSAHCGEKVSRSGAIPRRDVWPARASPICAANRGAEALHADMIALLVHGLWPMVCRKAVLGRYAVL
eukprot:5016165-Prymnesium_polylepis.1